MSIAYSFYILIDLTLLYRIIQRAGVIPMSIAGIAKEVTQISVAAWLFGDELTPVNIVGVGVTVCGKLNQFVLGRRGLD